jgi:hypothetical protein
MDPNAQAYLAEQISHARLGPPVAAGDEHEWKQRTLRAFQAAVGALRAVAALSPAEAEEWTNHLLVALGERPLEPAQPGTIRLFSFAKGGRHRQARPPDPPPDSVFLGLVPAEQPDRPLEHGGRLQILGVELYSDAVTVTWRLAPEPDYEVLFADELAEQAPDLEGLPEPQRQRLRRQLVQRLQMQRRPFLLADDVGTEYHQMGGGSSTGQRGKRGHTDFLPGVPADARVLSLTWGGDTTFEVPLHR